MFACSTTKNYNERVTNRYEKRVKRMYSDSIVAEVVNQNNIDVKIHILDSFPLSSQLSKTIDSGIVLGKKCKTIVVYTNPKGKIFETSSVPENCTGYQFSHKTGSCAGYGGILQMYIPSDDLIEGVYTYKEMFDMGTGSYELLFKFYYDPKTMISGAGTHNNNGYWMTDNK